MVIQIGGGESNVPGVSHGLLYNIPLIVHYMGKGAITYVRGLLYM